MVGNLGYCYEIEFRSTHQHCKADALSRLLLNMKDSKNGSKATLFNIYQIETLPVTAIEIQRATRRDPVLSQVLHFSRNGWPEHMFGQLETFHAKQHEIFNGGGLSTMGYACHY